MLAEGVEQTRVLQAFTGSGIHEVFDLSVDHPLHNFVANGLLVHNKKPPPKTCVLEGQQVAPGAACACAGGVEGETDCYSEPVPFCLCPAGGSSDGGSSDGGSSDGGSSDGGSSDGGSSDGG